MIKNGLIASVVFIIAMLALSVWAMPLLPIDGQFATHWNINGEADDFSGRNTVLWLMPGIGFAMAVVFSILPSIDPRRKNLLRSGLPYQIAWIGMLCILALAHAMMVLNATKIVNLVDITTGPDLLRWMAVFAGVFVTALGAVMGKIRPNWFMGVRTPWTLSSDLAWDKTHRFTGWLFMLTGLVTVAAALVLIPRWAMTILIVGMIGSGLLAVIYSYLVWKSDPARETLVPDSAD